MSGIVERLRAEATDNKRYLVPDDLALEAAAEIDGCGRRWRGLPASMKG